MPCCRQCTEMTGNRSSMPIPMPWFATPAMWLISAIGPYRSWKHRCCLQAAPKTRSSPKDITKPCSMKYQNAEETSNSTSSRRGTTLQCSATPSNSYSSLKASSGKSPQDSRNPLLNWGQKAGRRFAHSRGETIAPVGYRISCPCNKSPATGQCQLRAIIFSLQWGDPG